MTGYHRRSAGARGCSGVNAATAGAGALRPGAVGRREELFGRERRHGGAVAIRLGGVGRDPELEQWCRGVGLGGLPGIGALAAFDGDSTDFAEVRIRRIEVAKVQAIDLSVGNS